MEVYFGYFDKKQIPLSGGEFDYRGFMVQAFKNCAFTGRVRVPNEVNSWIQLDPLGGLTSQDSGLLDGLELSDALGIELHLITIVDSSMSASYAYLDSGKLVRLISGGEVTYETVGKSLSWEKSVIGDRKDSSAMDSVLIRKVVRYFQFSGFNVPKEQRANYWLHDFQSTGLEVDG